MSRTTIFPKPISPKVPQQCRIAGTAQQAQNRIICRICAPRFSAPHFAHCTSHLSSDEITAIATKRNSAHGQQFAEGTACRFSMEQSKRYMEAARGARSPESGLESK
jgi:hypothetical protein